MSQLADSIISIVSALSTKFGTGVLVNDIMLFLLLVALVTFLFAVAAFRHTYNLRTPPGLDRVNSIGGKVEKVEMNLGEFRIETVRSMEIFRGDLGYIKQELGQISSNLKILAKSVQQGNAGFGMQNLGGTDEFAAPTAPQENKSDWQEDELPLNPLADDLNKKKV